jgi:hypothetical protein
VNYVLALLPLAAFLCVFVAFGSAFPEWGWRRTFVRAFVAIGCYMVLANEGLSLIGGITQIALAGVWGLPILAVGVRTFRLRTSGQATRLPSWRFNFTPAEWLLIAGVVIIAGVTAAVAWIAPPNTWDSLTYHMSRVAHWAQDASLRPYPTGIERQNFMSPVAEIGMLQVYVLAMGDRLVNFIEWFSMLVSIVAVTLLARDLGAGRLGQVFAAVFVVTLPQGIAQASSTMTDYVVAVWAISVACEAVQMAQGAKGKAPPIFAGLAAGLTIGSKPTGFAYLLPLAVLIGIALWRYRGIGEMAKWAAVAVVLVIVVNAGYFGRNMALYGNPIGRQRSVEGHSNEILDWRVVVSNTLRNASLHAGTPYSRVNDWLYLTLAKVHVKIGLDLTDPRTTVHADFLILGPTPDETRAGNPLQAVLILIASALAIVMWRKVGMVAAIYTIAVALSFIAISVMFKFTVFGSRYHMGFFVLAAPIAGYVMWKLMPRTLLVLTALGLIIASREWVLGINQRPLIAMTRSASPSILQTPRLQMYLDKGPLNAYQKLADAAMSAQCSTVGVMLSGNSPEYMLWVLFGAPRRDLRMEWIVGGTASARYEDPNFEPCAVICDGSCEPGMQSVRGLPLFLQSSEYRLFMKPPVAVLP